MAILRKYQRERPKQRPRPHRRPLEHKTTSTEDRDLEKESFEDSEGDGLMSEGDIMFPSEDEDDS